jgi:hypothetical protein
MVHAIVDHNFLDIHKQHDLVFHNINKDCLYVNVVFPALWRAWILFYQSAWGRSLVRLLNARLTLQVENFFLLLMVHGSFVLLMVVLDAFLVDIQRTCYDTK